VNAAIEDARRIPQFGLDVDIDVTYEVVGKTPPPFHNTAEHFPILKRYAGKCKGVVEFGYWQGRGSTLALLAGRPEWMLSVDVAFDSNNLAHSQALAKSAGVRWGAVTGDSAEIEIPECDFLFVDSDHTYEHCSKEIEQHIDKVRKWIGFHDTVTHGETDMATGEEGVLRAVAELVGSGYWSQDYHSDDSHGLTILKRD
jgi:hypothetical protein